MQNFTFNFCCNFFRAEEAHILILILDPIQIPLANVRLKIEEFLNGVNFRKGFQKLIICINKSDLIMEEEQRMITEGIYVQNLKIPENNNFRATKKRHFRRVE